MKKFLSALIVLIALAATAQAAEPVRIARVPIVFQCSAPDEKTCSALETKIERAVHIPLNGYLQVAEYLPPDSCAQALNDIWSRLSADDRKAKLADAMRPLADELDADIIVCPVLLAYRQIVFPAVGWSGETFIDSYAAAQLIVYDRRTDELIDKDASRMHYDTLSGLGTASYLAATCFDQIIAQTKLRERIRAIGR